MKPHQYNRGNSLRYRVNSNKSMVFLARSRISNNRLKQSASRQNGYQNVLLSPYNIKLNFDLPVQFKQQQTHQLEPQHVKSQAINLPIGEEVRSNRQSLFDGKNKMAKGISPSHSKYFRRATKITTELNCSIQSRSLPTGEYRPKNPSNNQSGGFHGKWYLKSVRKKYEYKDLKGRARKAWTQSSIYQQTSQRQSLPMKTNQNDALPIHSLTRRPQANGISNEGSPNVFKLPNLSKSIQTPVVPLGRKGINLHKQMAPLHQQKMLNFLKKYQKLVSSLHSKTERPSRKLNQDIPSKQQISVRSKHLQLSQKQRKRNKEERNDQVQTKMANLNKCK